MTDIDKKLTELKELLESMPRLLVNSENYYSIIHTIHNYLPELIAEIERLRTVLNIEIHGSSIDWKLRANEAVIRAKKAEAEIEKLSAAKTVQMAGAIDTLAEMGEYIEQCDAANACVEKAKADLLIEQRALAGFKIMLETAKERAEQMQAERDVLAKECAEFQKVIDCDAKNQQHDYRNWLEWAAHEAAKRQGEV